MKTENNKAKDRGGGKIVKCYICKKAICLEKYNDDYIYKFNEKKTNRHKYCCGWNCYRKARGYD